MKCIMRFMKKVVIIGVLLIGLAIAFVVINDASMDKDEGSASPSTSSTTVTPQPTQSSDTQTSAGQYVNYSDTVIASTPGTKLLFFHAPWCPQCRELEASIKADTIPQGVSIIKVDYDSNQALRGKYGVTLQTTVVKVDDAGNLVKKYVAYDEPSLQAVTKNLL